MSRRTNHSKTAQRKHSQHDIAKIGVDGAFDSGLVSGYLRDVVWFVFARISYEDLWRARVFCLCDCRGSRDSDTPCDSHFSSAKETIVVCWTARLDDPFHRLHRFDVWNASVRLLRNCTGTQLSFSDFHQRARASNEPFGHGNRIDDPRSIAWVCNSGDSFLRLCANHDPRASVADHASNDDASNDDASNTVDPGVAPGDVSLGARRSKTRPRELVSRYRRSWPIEQRGGERGYIER